MPLVDARARWLSTRPLYFQTFDSTPRHSEEEERLSERQVRRIVEETIRKRHPAPSVADHATADVKADISDLKRSLAKLKGEFTEKEEKGISKIIRELHGLARDVENRATSASLTSEMAKIIEQISDLNVHSLTTQVTNLDSDLKSMRDEASDGSLAQKIAQLNAQVAALSKREDTAQIAELSKQINDMTKKHKSGETGTLATQLAKLQKQVQAIESNKAVPPPPAALTRLERDIKTIKTKLGNYLPEKPEDDIASHVHGLGLSLQSLNHKIAEIQENQTAMGQLADLQANLKKITGSDAKKRPLKTMYKIMDELEDKVAKKDWDALEEKLKALEPGSPAKTVDVAQEIKKRVDAMKASITAEYAKNISAAEAVASKALGSIGEYKHVETIAQRLDKIDQRLAKIEAKKDGLLAGISAEWKDLKAKVQKDRVPDSAAKAGSPDGLLNLLSRIPDRVGDSSRTLASRESAMEKQKAKEEARAKKEREEEADRQKKEKAAARALAKKEEEKAAARAQAKKQREEERVATRAREKKEKEEEEEAKKAKEEKAKPKKALPKAAKVAPEEGGRRTSARLAAKTQKTSAMPELDISQDTSDDDTTNENEPEIHELLHQAIVCLNMQPYANHDDLDEITNSLSALPMLSLPSRHKVSDVTQRQGEMSVLCTRLYETASELAMRNNVHVELVYCDKPYTQQLALLSQGHGPVSYHNNDTGNSNSSSAYADTLLGLESEVKPLPMYPEETDDADTGEFFIQPSNIAYETTVQLVPVSAEPQNFDPATSGGLLSVEDCSDA